jgi:surface protein
MCWPSSGCDGIVIGVGCSSPPSFLLSVRVDCECKRPSFLATVFNGASVFNGDLNQWDVAKVTTMSYSKSKSILEKVSGLCIRVRV